MAREHIPFLTMPQNYYEMTVADVARRTKKVRCPVIPGLFEGHFQAGHGDRNDDCATYHRCLTLYQGSGQAQCPKGCAHYKKRPHWADLAEAHVQRDER